MWSFSKSADEIKVVGKLVRNDPRKMKESFSSFNSCGWAFHLKELEGRVKVRAMCKRAGRKSCGCQVQARLTREKVHL